MHYSRGHHYASVVKYDQKHAPITFLIDTYKGDLYDGMGKQNIKVDAHFKLQNLGLEREKSDVMDHNCHLYTVELTKAAVSYLQKNDTSQLHQACIAKDYEQAKEILHNGMKPYLPYYDCSQSECVRKSRKKIEQYHRDLRWTISGEVIMNDLKSRATQKKTA